MLNKKYSRFCRIETDKKGKYPLRPANISAKLISIFTPMTDSFTPQGWTSPFFTKEAYDKYLEENEYDHNGKFRREDQDIFDWLMEDKEILDMGADGMTMKETLAMLK